MGCEKEKENEPKNKFNPVYEPDITDCQATLPFTKSGVKKTEMWTGDLRDDSIMNLCLSLKHLRSRIYLTAGSTLCCHKGHNSNESSIVWE